MSLEGDRGFAFFVAACLPRRCSTYPSCDHQFKHTKYAIVVTGQLQGISTCGLGLWKSGSGLLLAIATGTRRKREVNGKLLRSPKRNPLAVLGMGALPFGCALKKRRRRKNGTLITGGDY